jgi:hypothetical protein
MTTEITITTLEDLENHMLDCVVLANTTSDKRLQALTQARVASLVKKIAEWQPTSQEETTRVIKMSSLS